MEDIKVSDKFSITENGKVSKKKLLDALALLKSDVEFLTKEVEKADL